MPNILKPQPYEISKEDREKIIEYFGTGPEVFHKLRFHCPNNDLLNNYPNLPESMNVQFSRSWAYLKTYLMPAIMENYQSLTEIRVKKARELPTHTTISRIIATMQNILHIFDNWLDSNTNNVEFFLQIHYKYKHLMKQFQPFLVVHQTDLTKRVKQLYIKIHWDAFTTAFDAFCNYLNFEQYEHVWEAGLKDYLNAQHHLASYREEIKKGHSIPMEYHKVTIMGTTVLGMAGIVDNPADTVRLEDTPYCKLCPYQTLKDGEFYCNHPNKKDEITSKIPCAEKDWVDCIKTKDKDGTNQKFCEYEVWKNGQWACNADQTLCETPSDLRCDEPPFTTCPSHPGYIEVKQEPILLSNPINEGHPTKSEREGDILVSESVSPKKPCRNMVEIDGIKKCNFRVIMEEITEPETIPHPELCSDDECGWIEDDSQVQHKEN